MKFSKIPGLGRFGTFIDDIDLEHVTDEEWMMIGQNHLENLVTIIRAPRIDHKRYADLICKWGTPRYNIIFNIYLKYGKFAKEMIFSDEIEDVDREALLNARNFNVDKRYPMVGRVTPKKNSRGKNIGVFGDGELHWHSNECGNYWFSPAVSLMGVENMVGSATGFLTTVDYYESLSESTRSELDDMIVVHNYYHESLSPEIIDDQEGFYKNNMCFYKDGRVPLIIQNPIGIKGIHLGINTFDKIEGMTREQSDQLFNKIKKEMFVDKYTYHHWYQNDSDLLIFDNSITLHNRTIKDNGKMPDRLAYRIQFDYDHLAGEYDPYYQDSFNVARRDIMQKYKEVLENM